MKNIHGKIVFLFMLLIVQLNAIETKYCSYSISSSKKSAVLNEPISITFKARQKIHNEVMFFDLKPHKSKDYEVISIKEKRHEFNYHDAKKEFEFLLIPKKEGLLSVPFDFRIRRASDDAVAQAYTGSRDNVKSIPTIKINIDIPTVTLNITSLKNPVDAVGDFNLAMSIDKTEISSYDKVNVVYTLQGRGFLNKNFEPIEELEGISIFKGKKEKEPRATKEGYIYQVEWSYALVSSDNYKVPAVTLKTYNYLNKQYLDKNTPSKMISVKHQDIESLIDDEESPQSTVDYKKYIDYFYSFLIFSAGFLFAKLLEYLPKKLSNKKQCCPLIKNAKNPKELLKQTTPYLNKYPLKDEIRALESLVYTKNSKENFSSLKDKIIKKIEL